jgi:hypothetical protein
MASNSDCRSCISNTALARSVSVCASVWAVVGSTTVISLTTSTGISLTTSLTTGTSLIISLGGC